MRTLFIVNDPPYGTERAYNALRLAISLIKREGEEVRLFLIADAAACAKTGQTVPQGYYNVERMMKAFRTRGRGDRGVRHLHGRPGPHRCRAGGGSTPEHYGRGHRLDLLGGQGGGVLILPQFTQPGAPHANPARWLKRWGVADPGQDILWAQGLRACFARNSWIMS
jgi:hypothetical protein